MTRCEYIPVSSASPSLARKVTVPPVPGIWAYICGYISNFKQRYDYRIAPNSPRCRRQPLAQITWLSSCQSPAVCSRTGDPVTRREYVHVASTKTSLFSTVTVPPVPGIWAYFCGHIGSFKQVSSHRITPIPPRCRRKPLAQITWLRYGCRSSDSRIRDERLKR